MEKKQRELLMKLLELGDITLIRKSRESIIASIKAMDIETLGYLLDDDRTYQDATKEFFLQKLGEAFAKFKKLGDSSLVTESGKCGSCSCINAGKHGLSFCGNVSDTRLNLIIEGSGEQVTDIYECRMFGYDSGAAPFIDEIHIDIRTDEEASFKPSVDYLIKTQQCQSALEELYRAGDVLTKDFYRHWLAKHKELSGSVFHGMFEYRSYDRFHWQYHELARWANELVKEAEVEAANSAYAQLDNDDEKLVLNYLLSYEDLWFPFAGFSSQYDQRDLDNGFFSAYRVKISTADFQPLIDFVSNYERHYYPLLEKYRTITYDEIEGKRMTSDEQNDFHSLRFHLTMRGLI